MNFRKEIFISYILLSLATTCFAQIPDRYRIPVFSQVIETSNVQFSTSVPKVIHQPFFWDLFSGGIPINTKEYNTEPINLYMDIFEPVGDVAEKRPLVIICFGGGFVQGNRDYWSMRLLAEGLAKMGYVTASIDYRLGMNLFDKEIGARSVYRGVQDSRSAVRFFKADSENSNTYKIDTNNIFIGGHSSGGFIALHNIFMDDEAAGERPCSTYDWSQDGNNIPDLGCLDCVGDNQGYSGRANGIFNLAGALGYLNLIDGPANDPPPILFHSTDDLTVPYDVGEPFQDMPILGFIGGDLPTVYGSSLIANRCDTVGLSKLYNEYTNRGHGVHEETEPTTLYSDILPGIGDWLYNNHLKPETGTFNGNVAFCPSENSQTIIFENTEITYFDWQITGGIFQSMSNSSNEVIVNWDLNAAENKVTLAPFTCNGSSGEIQEFIANKFEEGNNIWMGQNGDSWDDVSKWSRAHLPLSCEIMVIPGVVSSTTLNIPANLNLIVRGIQIGENIELNIPLNSSVTVENE